MKITFLGTGSAIPTGDRVQTGYLIDHHSPMLLDCGSGVLHQLARTEVGITGISTVLLSHHHIDHVSDLMALLKARWLTGADSLTIAGPPGTETLVQDLLDVHGYMQNRLSLTFIEITPGETTLNDIKITAMETRHSMECLAYRFSTDAGTITISGDTEAFDDLIDFASKSDSLIHDCSFPDDVDVSNHPTPSQLGTVLEGNQFDTVYLTHLYPHTNGEHEAMLESIAEHYDGSVVIAKDGDTITP